MGRLHIDKVPTLIGLVAFSPIANKGRCILVHSYLGAQGNLSCLLTEILGDLEQIRVTYGLCYKYGMWLSKWAHLFAMITATKMISLYSPFYYSNVHNGC